MRGRYSGAAGDGWAQIGSVRVDLLSRCRVLDRFRTALAGGRPLAVASANLDHLHHFAHREPPLPSGGLDGVDWLTLLDGRPVARAVRRALGPASAELHPGSELLPHVLSLAAETGARVVLLGGSDDLRRAWSAALAAEYAGLRDAGTRRVDWPWLDQPGAGAELAGWVAERRADVVVISLGKPRQELWMRDHGGATRARLLLAFGSAAEYVAGTTRRPPDWAGRHGLEWAVRLVREPRRLWRRYLIRGPRALLLLRGAAYGRDRPAKSGHPPP
jgi:N-acetylglucosaminyldiphosphoundecaprenol N-acetyl-beta-D-mannosaminyltransferase